MPFFKTDPPTLEAKRGDQVSLMSLETIEKTIKIHRGRVMAKMKVQAVADLVRALEKIGMRPTSPLPSA